MASLRTSAGWRVLDGFGGSVRALSRSVCPTSVDELARVFTAARAEGLSVSFRGAGRSYGDASLNSGQLAVDGRGMRRILAFDRETGVIDAEGGASIADVWRRTLPEGWWPAVVPGTMFPTLAGCTAMNIHGKNCFKVGPFGDHVLELDLLTAEGERLTLSRERNPELFHATIAGLGLLGAVTRVKLHLKHVETGRLRVRPIVSPTLAHMFDTFVERMPGSDYLVGWVDCFATGPALGRGLVHQANHITAAEDPNGRRTLALAEQDLPPRLFGVPKSLLWMLLKPFTNDTGMRFVNSVKYTLPEPVAKDGTYRDSHAGYAFLLDYIPNWRLGYGARGAASSPTWACSSVTDRTTTCSRTGSMAGRWRSISRCRGTRRGYGTRRPTSPGSSSRPAARSTRPRTRSSTRRRSRARSASASCASASCAGAWTRADSSRTTRRGGWASRSGSARPAVPAGRRAETGREQV